jgi:hypothetical protein
MNEFDSEKMRDLRKKFTLDCETRESALLSVSKIFGLTRTDLTSFFRQFDLWDYVEKHGCGSEGPGNLLLKTLLMQIECNWGFSHTAWFHMTRCLPTEEFKDGLKTYSGIIDDIWELLFDINPSDITRSDWNKLRMSMESDMSSNLGIYHDCRTRSDEQEGPYGILVPELRSGNPIIKQDHYLEEAPEVVSHICEKNSKLLAEYKKATKPCIVKFETSDNELYLLSVALLYVYESQLSEPQFSSFHNADYRGRGLQVNSNQIKKLIFLGDE